MLAYVFWHWKLPAAEQGHYEQDLQAFHAALREQRPAGFQRSLSYALAGLPWAADGQPAYEDWYLVDGSAALDLLNDAAVDAGRLARHDRLAYAAAGGIGGLYRLRQGAPLDAQARWGYWFGKPDGMRYAELCALLDPLAEGAALWGRQMTLGPTPEFCLHSRAPLALPAPLDVQGVALRAV